MLIMTWSCNITYRELSPLPDIWNDREFIGENFSMKIPYRKYLFQLHPWPFMCTSMIISSWENSEENAIFLPCFSTEFARYYLTGNKQKIARRTVYFSTSVRPVMFRLWHDHCTSPTFSRKLHLFFYRTHKVLDDTLLSRILIRR